MKRTRQEHKRRALVTWARLLPVLLALFVARDAPARALAPPRAAHEASLACGQRPARIVSWAAALAPIDVSNASTQERARICLYKPSGDIDEKAREEFERVASREPEPHTLSSRVEQLVFKAAHHFRASHVVIVSGWRAHGGKHARGEAVDFRVEGIHASKVAAYLRSLSRVGVGIYTHPDTQFVHVDVREPSYAWVDASAPGVHGWERQLGVPHADKRDAAYQPEMDLPE